MDPFHPRISQLLTSSVLYRRKERKQSDKLHPKPQPAQQQVTAGGTVTSQAMRKRLYSRKRGLWVSSG